MKIFLIGLPGSGKSTLGKSLAGKLKLPFFDLDEENEKSEGQPVYRIFEEKKEEYFRTIESETLRSFCSSPNDFVMAVGGGAPCFHDNMNQMNQAGFTLFLDVPIKTIAERLLNTNLKERPLFAGFSENDVENKLETLLKLRMEFYILAGATAKGDSLSADDLLKIIK